MTRSEKTRGRGLRNEADEGGRGQVTKDPVNYGKDFSRYTKGTGKMIQL